MLKTSFERLEGNNVKLTVVVPSDEVDAAIAASYASVGKKMRIPGFRKGHAPRPVVDNYVGKDYVLAEATEALINTAYPRAIDAEGLRTVEAPEMDAVDNVVPGQEYTFVAEVELRPEFALTSTDDFAVTVPPRQASDYEIDLQIDNMRDRFATLEPVEDRGLAADDFALVSFVGYVDGEPYEGNEVDKYLYEMGKGLMPAQFDEALIGAEPGSETVVEFEIPDTSNNPEFIGKTARFEVTVHEVKAKKLPEVDDEFATNVGGFDTVEQMRDDLRTRMSVQKSLTHDREKETALRIQLAERLEGEAPPALVKNRASSMLRDFLAALEAREMTMEQYVEATGVPVASIEADINNQAVESVMQDLALEALFRAKDMEITEADIDEELGSIAEGTKTSPEDARKKWEDMGLMPVVREQIMHRKAVYWLMENCVVTEADPHDADDSDAGSADAEKPAKTPAKKPAKKSAEKPAKEDAVTKAPADEAPADEAPADEAPADAAPKSADAPENTEE